MVGGWLRSGARVGVRCKRRRWPVGGVGRGGERTKRGRRMVGAVGCVGGVAAPR